MGEYFEKETFKSWMKENITENPMILTAIDYAPSADVEPVRHGHWVEHDEDTWSNEAECSECHKRIGYSGLPDRFLREFKYCHNCGAKMDKKKENEV